MTQRGCVFLLLLWSVAFGAAAIDAAPFLSLPIDCQMGEPLKGANCFLDRLMDHDLSERVADYQCGPRSYNAPSRFGAGHQGVDFAILPPGSWQTEAGVKILAAADGMVLGVRDTMQDRAIESPQDQARLAGQACGNGLSILHDGGYVSQYCHLRAGSLAVRSGDIVQRGALLGLVGLSGQTSYPHLHFQLMRGEGESAQNLGALTPIDPFDGSLITEACQVGGKSLWLPNALSDLGYRPVLMLALGFTKALVNDDRLLAGLSGDKKLSGDGIQAFAYMTGGRIGDKIKLEVTDPDDHIIVSGERVLKSQRSRNWVAANVTSARRFAKKPGLYRLKIQVFAASGQPEAEGKSAFFWSP